ncbi:MAG: hypothetical protein UW24_C0032G0006 [Parcubacteria group bacterium GW2011_GWA2_44_12]|nr:MAG: hypothetical protein UW24_C0032G0006 [Parcubacteria group bacterium GW2011_GWA2_44_12]
MRQSLGVIQQICHCGERSDEAIPTEIASLTSFARNDTPLLTCACRKGLIIDRNPHIIEIIV